jgi:hypothetical protein
LPPLQGGGTPLAHPPAAAGREGSAGGNESRLQEECKRMNARAKERMIRRWVIMAVLGVIAGVVLSAGTGCDLERSPVGFQEDFYLQEESNYDAADVLETYLSDYVIY